MTPSTREEPDESLPNAARSSNLDNNQAGHEARALRPLWLLTTGAVIAVIGAGLAARPGPAVVHWILLGLGATALVTAVGGSKRQVGLLWLVAGLALGSGRGLQNRQAQIDIERLMASSSELAFRIECVVCEGWRRSRWGRTTRARVLSATQAGNALRLPTRCRLEVRGDPDPDLLPDVGATIAALVAIRGDPSRPLLVARSTRLLEWRSPPGGMAHTRNRLARGLLAAAGTDPGRIRSAELAAALALGRADLVPRSRREGWRKSGLAHVLAVSGLHVGLVGGSVWLLAIALGATPRAARIAILAVLPTYALLAGASPSALRAALMGVIYLAARLLGRALIPIAAVLLAALVLILAEPTLVSRPGFQLTVLITAALVRWVPTLANSLPGPKVISGAISVPLVAQIAAAPISAWHFRTLVPGAVLANMAVPLLIAPTLLIAITATLVAALIPAAAAPLLEALTWLRELLWLSAAPGRATSVVMPAMPAAMAAVLAVVGWLALQAGRRSRWWAVTWMSLLAATGAWAVLPAAPADRFSLLAVGEGLSAVGRCRDGAVLIDAGRAREEAARLLADQGLRRLDAAVLTHPDEDHMGGMAAVLAGLRVGELIVPAWMLGDEATVPLLRLARRRGTRIRVVSRGSALRTGRCGLEVLWPPVRGAPTGDNDRSLVARLRLDRGTALVTADIGRDIEHRLTEQSSLGCEILLIPHHGSRSSASASFLNACRPQVALIPAGPRNPHNHPHANVLARLQQRRIPFRSPKADGNCGARPDRDGVWRPYP